MSNKNLFLVSKLGTLLVVGLFVLSNSPVLALAADELSQPENPTPTVEVVETVETEVEVVEVAEPEVTADAPEVVDVPEEAATSTDEVLVEESNTDEATSTDPVLTEDADTAPVVMMAASAPQAEKTAQSDPHFAISDEFGDTSASQPDNGGNTTPGEHTFTTVSGNTCGCDGDDDDTASGENQFVTLPNGEVAGISAQDSFRTLPTSGCTDNCGGGGCTSGCGGNDDEVVSAENNFITLPGGGCTSGCGGNDDESVSAENSFRTLSDSGCTSNCGGDGDEVVSGENSFTTSNDGGGGGGDDDDDDNGGGGGGGGGHSRHRDRDELPAACEVYLKKFIRLGYANDPFEVTKLEVFLNAFEGFDLPVNGIYEQHDFEAVSIFQKRYLGAVLTPWGINDSTGYVYITTTLTINQIYCRHTVGNDLDLRNVFPVYGAGGALEGISNTPSATTTPSGEATTTPSILDLPELFEAAAVGLLDFVKDWWCLLIIIILILVIAYLLDERERLAKKLADTQTVKLQDLPETEVMILPADLDENEPFTPSEVEEVSEDQKPLL